LTQKLINRWKESLSDGEQVEVNHCMQGFVFDEREYFSGQAFEAAFQKSPAETLAQEFVNHRFMEFLVEEDFNNLNTPEIVFPHGIKVIPGNYSNENWTRNALLLDEVDWKTLTVNNIVTTAIPYEAWEDNSDEEGGDDLFAIQLSADQPTQCLSYDQLVALLREKQV